MQTLFDLLGAFRHRIWGCCLGIVFLLLLAALSCGALGWVAAYRSGAASAPAVAPNGYDVYLLLDQSNSMWNLNGLGSDPDMLRVAAANLFLSYLGADDPGREHRAGVIYFGGASELVAPLTGLDAASRAALSQQLADPVPIPWTDPAEALALAASELSQTADPGRRRAIVLLTDGQPAWEGADATARDIYRQQLMADVARLGEQGISLYVVLLASPATDVSEEITTVWAPFWRQAAALTPRGAFFQARQAQELLGLYHQVVAGLTGGQVGDQIADAPVAASGRYTFTVEPQLAQLTLVVWKSDPAMRVEPIDPQGQMLDLSAAGVRYAGRPGESHEEVWTVTQPAPGEWALQVMGEGRLTAWLDTRLAPATPTPTTTPSATRTATATRTPSSTTTPTPTHTATPTPTLTHTHTPAPTTTVTPLALPLPAPEPGGGSRSLLARFSPWLLAVLLAAGGAGLFWRQRHQPRLWLEGSLLPLATPMGATTPPRIDLSQHPARSFMLGQGRKADVSLPGWQGLARLEAGEDEGAAVVHLIRLEGELTVNGLPVEEHVLRDGDLIAAGDYRFRFQHVASARQSWRQGKLAPL